LALILAFTPATTVGRSLPTLTSFFNVCLGMGR
jgi:hypothetical protein